MKISVLIIFVLSFADTLISTKNTTYFHFTRNSTIEVYRMDMFPTDKVALHMPCEESNMFATKCMVKILCIFLGMFML